VHTDFRSATTTIIERCDVAGPKYRLDPITTLTQAIDNAR
jgi:hypothetical protein